MILVPARGVFPFEKVTSEREREVSFPFPSSVTKGSLCFQIVKEISEGAPISSLEIKSKERILSFRYHVVGCSLCVGTSTVVTLFEAFAIFTSVY